MTFSFAAPTSTTGSTPVDAAVRAAREQVTAFFAKELAPGCAGEVLDQATRVWEELDLLKHQMVAALARIEASGQLLDQGGHRDLAKWLRHSFAISAAQAGELASVGRADARNSMPDTIKALESGTLSFGESAAIVKSVERAVEKRDARDNEDPDLFRAKMESGLLSFKEMRPNTSVSGIGQAAHQLSTRLNPNRAELDHEAAHAERGAKLTRTFGGSFLFQAWGSAADALRLEAALEGYANPYDAEDGLSRSQSTYDAFCNAVGFAQSHQKCEKPTTAAAVINILVPATTLAGLDGDDPATTRDGQVVPTSAVRELLTDSLVRHLMVEQNSGAVLDVGHEYRVATPRIRAAAFLGHTTCAWQHGCDVPLKWTQADHIVEWWQGGTTSADNIQPLCSTHNRLKHRWGLRRDKKRWAGRTRGRPGRPPGPPVQASPLRE
ncbi:hypothetical protein H4W79_000591 [Nocardiopsis terrae]|uniref:HNH nuclease domain-containing protein n=1 Tax=Nocardiopsis terrae TaxID=372655 RepID=A0ABR9HBH2_9ACTN|nr:HNH endonuclease signature motif containing protein [Nocardiopsis terrae]MBE1456377.1 hypothetical protein [Nocardiopsis terrae]